MPLPKLGVFLVIPTVVSALALAATGLAESVQLDAEITGDTDTADLQSCQVPTAAGLADACLRVQHAYDWLDEGRSKAQRLGIQSDGKYASYFDFATYTSAALGRAEARLHCGEATVPNADELADVCGEIDLATARLATVVDPHCGWDPICAVAVSVMHRLLKKGRDGMARVSSDLSCTRVVSCRDS